LSYLLDTHIVLWSLSAPEKLDKEIISIIKSPNTVAYVSVVSVIEISIKKSIGKLKIKDSYLDVLRSQNFTFLPIEVEDADLLKSLSLIHKDPFDRLLIAQAMNKNLTLISKDAFFQAYDIKLLEA